MKWRMGDAAMQAITRIANKFSADQLPPTDCKLGQTLSTMEIMANGIIGHGHVPINGALSYDYVVQEICGVVSPHAP